MVLKFSLRYVHLNLMVFVFSKLIKFIDQMFRKNLTNLCGYKNYVAKHLDPRVITVRKRRQEKFYNNNLVSRETIDERKKSEQNWGKKN